MLVLAIGLAVLLIWAVFAFYTHRGIKLRSAQTRNSAIQFELQAAPWSDRHVESLLARNPDNPILLRQYVANAAEQKDWPEALRRADFFAAQAPRSPQAWVMRADVLRRAGREEEGVALLRKAVRRMPRDPEILVAWANEAVRRRDWAEAARRFARVRRYGPGRLYGYEDGANVLLEAGRGDEAQAVIEEGLRLVSKDWTWAMLRASARVAGRLGNHDEAIRRWEALRDQFPGQPDGFLGGAEALARAGRGEAAAALIRQARDFFPGNERIAEAAVRLLAPEVPEPPQPPASPARDDEGSRRP